MKSVATGYQTELLCLRADLRGIMDYPAISASRVDRLRRGGAGADLSQPSPVVAGRIRLLFFGCLCARFASRHCIADMCCKFAAQMAVLSLRMLQSSPTTKWTYAFPSARAYTSYLTT